MLLLRFGSSVLVIFVKLLVILSTSLVSLMRVSFIGLEESITSEVLKGMIYLRQMYLICELNFAMRSGKKRGNIYTLDRPKSLEKLIYRNRRGSFMLQLEKIYLVVI